MADFILQNTGCGVATDSGAAKSVNVTILSTMLTDFHGLGEWGFSALIEVDGYKILFDTGARPQTVLQNAKELKIDLSKVEDVFLSHNHWDHSEGLMNLRSELSKENPQAMSRVFVAEGIFESRPSNGQENNTIIKIRKDYESTGGEFILIRKPTELIYNVWSTGPVERVYKKEKNWSGTGVIKTNNGVIEDVILEDQSIAINSSRD